MKFYSFYLFYILTIFILFVGYKTGQAQIIGPKISYGDTAIIKEKLWPYYLTMSCVALLTALIYHYWFKTDRLVKTRSVVLHFITSTLGILLTFNVYGIITLLMNSGAPDTTALAFGDITFFISLPGPILIIVSFVLFIMGLARAKQTPV